MVLGRLLAKLAPTSLASQQFPPPSTFDPARDMPDLTGKAIIVTGGSAGIGYHTAKALLLKHATIYIAGRDPGAAAQRLAEETGRPAPEVLKLDLADLRSVSTAAAEFLRKEERLDVLFNNAGVLIPPNDLLTAQGYDLQFEKLLLPALKRVHELSGIKARVLHTSSQVHESAPGPTGIECDVLKSGPARDATLARWGAWASKWKLYAASKMGVILLSKILAQHHSDFVASCALHPGSGLQTNVMQHTPGWQQQVFKVLASPAHYGAWTQLWAGTVLDAETMHGQYFIPWARVGKADPRANSETTREELRAWLEEQVEEF